MPVDAFKFEGGKALEAALKQLPQAAAKAAMRRTLKKAAAPVRERWQANAPRQTGQYEHSIVIGTKLTRRQSRTVRREGKSNVELYIGTSDPAGVQLEFGNARQAAQPSGRPAWDATQDDALRITGTESWIEIDKTAKRLAKKAAKLK